MTTEPQYDSDPQKRVVAVQLRALADAIQRTDSQPAIMAEASRAVAADLQSLAAYMYPMNTTERR